MQEIACCSVRKKLLQTPSQYSWATHCLPFGCGVCLGGRKGFSPRGIPVPSLQHFSLGLWPLQALSLEL